MYDDKIRELHKRLLRLERVASQSEEGRFFDNPLVRSVREFAESEAISNDIQVSENASKALESEKPKELIKSEAIVAPPTPTEIKRKPGGDEFSTLNQFVLKTEEDVRMPAPESAEKPPESLEEGKKDIAQKAEGREVSKSEKLRAIRQVMKKKSSGYWLLTQQRRVQKDNESRSKKRRNDDDDDELTDSELEVRRETRRYEEEMAKREEDKKQKKREKEKKEKDFEQRRKDRAKAREEAKVKKIRDFAKKAENYAKMKGTEKSQFTRQVYKMIGNVEKGKLQYKLRTIKDPEEKGREIARALKSLEGK